MLPDWPTSESAARLKSAPSFAALLPQFSRCESYGPGPEQMEPACWSDVVWRGLPHRHMLMPGQNSRSAAQAPSG